MDILVPIVKCFFFRYKLQMRGDLEDKHISSERAVQTFKAGMKRMDKGTVETKLSRFLMTYRVTPHSTTGLSPAQMLMNRQPRTRLDFLRPDIQRRVNQKQFVQKENHDKRAKHRSFDVNATVYVQNFANGPRWLAGHITAVAGHLMYTVQLVDGRVWKRHVDHIRCRYVSQQPVIDPVFPTALPEREEMVGEQPTSVNGDPIPALQSPQPPENNTSVTDLRRSARNPNKPDRYGFPDM